MLEEVSETLERSGFKTFSVEKVKSTCFNLLAARDLSLLFVKALKNIDSISKEHVRDLKRISTFFNGVPLIVGKRNRRGELGPGVIYEKNDIKAMGLETLENIFRGEKPIAYADKGGLYVSLDGEELKKARKEKSITLGGLADHLGVSRSTIYKYEKNKQDATLKTALKLEEKLETSSILSPIDPMKETYKGKLEGKSIPKKSEVDNKLQLDVFTKLSDLGLLVTQIKKAPFDVLSRSESYMVMTGVSKNESPVVDKKARIVSHITTATKSSAMFVVEKKHNESIKHVPIFNKEDLKEIKDLDDLREKIEQKKHQS